MPDTSIISKEPSKPSPRPVTGTDTVTVCCNLPNGLLLQMYDIEVIERTLPNGDKIREHEANLNLEHGQYRLNGVAEFSTLAVANREIPDYTVIRGAVPGTGYALTPGIPRDFWEEWLRRNERNPIVKNRCVFAQSSETRARAQAREMKDQKSGFQGLNQSGDYRVPNGIRRYDRNDSPSREPAYETESAE